MELVQQKIKYGIPPRFLTSRLKFFLSELFVVSFPGMLDM